VIGEVTQSISYGYMEMGYKSSRAVGATREAAGEGEQTLEVEGDRGCESTRGHVVRSAEGGEKVIECVFVGYVDRCQLEICLESVGVKQVIFAKREIEEVAWSDAGRVVVVIAGTWRRNLKERRTVL
jgi:hypothetical protein